MLYISCLFQNYTLQEDVEHFTFNSGIFALFFQNFLKAVHIMLQISCTKMLITHCFLCTKSDCSIRVTYGNQTIELL